MQVVLIPAYNAVHTIAEVVFKAKEVATSVIVYDDGSTDDTAYVASRCGATVFREPENHGKGYALRKLFNYAKEFYSKYEPIIVTLDADMQHNPKDIPKLIQPILDGEADVVIGVRRGMPSHRKFANKILDLFSKHKESQSGFRAYRFEAIKNLELKQDGFAVDSEILQKLKHDFIIKTVEIQQRTDRYSHTKNAVSHFMEVFNFLFLQRPLLNLGILGVIGFVLGIFELVDVVNRWTLYKQLAIGTLLFGMLFAILGAFVFFVGVILHVIAHKKT